MKRVLMRLGQRILKQKKKLVYGALALCIFQVSFFGLCGIGVGNQVFAQSEPRTQDQVAQGKLKEWNSTFPFFKKIVYVLTYPMLVLAGKLVDNSFVYGEVFGFDAILWQLWNIVRNLANFTLGFIFVYKIFKYLINGKEKVKDIILSALIAGIGIQASWFVMATLIDVSTILTYAVGGLPISVLKDSGKTGTSTEYNPYVLKNVISIDVENVDIIHTYLTNTQVGDKKSGEFYISECETFSYGDRGSGSEVQLILAPEMTYYQKSSGNKMNYIPTDGNRCHYYGQVYYFKELYNGDSSDNLQSFVSGKKFLAGTGKQQDEYESALHSAVTNLLNKPGADVTTLIQNGSVLKIGNTYSTGGNQWGLDVHNEWTGTGGATSKLQDILDGNSYVGVFTALYSSLMNSGEGIITSESEAAKVLNSALSLGHALAVGIPLIVVAIVFMVRIGVLWVAIAISPFIVLASAFKDIGDKIFKGDFLEYFSLKNLIPIIFSPAIICFAISMSTVFVKIIQGINYNQIDTNSSEILGGLIQLDIGSVAVPIGKLFVSVLGIALTWFLVWAAIESSKIGESKFIKSIKDLVQTTLGSIPVVPVPGKDGKGVQFIGSNTAFGLNGQQGALSQITNKIKTKYEGESTEALNQWLDPESAENTAKTNAKSNRLNQYINGLTSGTIDQNWTNFAIAMPNDVLGNDGVNTSFNNVESGTDAQKVIDAINGLGGSKLTSIPDGHTVTAHGKTRVFKHQDKDNNPLYKYEEQNPTNPTSGGSSTPTSP